MAPVLAGIAALFTVTHDRENRAEEPPRAMSAADEAANEDQSNAYRSYEALLKRQREDVRDIVQRLCPEVGGSYRARTEAWKRADEGMKRIGTELTPAGINFAEIMRSGEMPLDAEMRRRWQRLMIIAEDRVASPPARTSLSLQKSASAYETLQLMAVHQGGIRIICPDPAVREKMRAVTLPPRPHTFAETLLAIATETGATPRYSQMHDQTIEWTDEGAVCMMDTERNVIASCIEQPDGTWVMRLLSDPQNVFWPEGRQTMKITTVNIPPLRVQLDVPLRQGWNDQEKYPDAALPVLEAGAQGNARSTAEEPPTVAVRVNMSTREQDIVMPIDASQGQTTPNMHLFARREAPEIVRVTWEQGGDLIEYFHKEIPPLTAQFLCEDGKPLSVLELERSPRVGMQIYTFCLRVPREYQGSIIARSYAHDEQKAIPLTFVLPECMRRRQAVPLSGVESLPPAPPLPEGEVPAIADQSR